jgi:hypothetical protein
MKLVLPQMRKQQSDFNYKYYFYCRVIWVPYRLCIQHQRALELITEALRMEVKSLGFITNIAPGDFATNIASSRYHAPVIKDSP